MKKKSVITITSIFLNLVLLSVLAHYDQINRHAASSPAPIFRVQHLSDIGYIQANRQGIVLASKVK